MQHMVVISRRQGVAETYRLVRLRPLETARGRSRSAEIGRDRVSETLETPCETLETLWARRDHRGRSNRGRGKGGLSLQSVSTWRQR